MSFESKSSSEIESAACGHSGRRHFLRTLGFAGAAMILGVQSEAQAFWFEPRQSPSDLLRSMKIPVEWMDRLGPTLPDYAKFLNRMKLRQVSVVQIIEPHLKTRGRVANTLPPKALWKNIGSTLRVLDRLCVTLDEPLTEVISAYRSPAYNAKCSGGKSNSQHLRNTALDLKFKSSPRIVARTLRELREDGLFLGGVGRYSGFTHLDTRGKNADW